MTVRVTVYIPVDEQAAERLGIRPRSAIVAQPGERAGHLLAYVQGADAQASLDTFADRVSLAAAMLEQARTTARREIPETLLRAVGRYDPREGDVTTFGAEESAALARYLDGDPEDLERELRTTSVKHQQRRSLRDALEQGTHPRAVVERLARQWGHEDLLSDRSDR